MPGRATRLAAGTDTWIGASGPDRMLQCSAALWSLRAAPSLHASTAAEKRPSRVSEARPTAYTPACTGCSRPFATRTSIARLVYPIARSCRRVITQCWSRDSLHASLAIS